MPPKKKAAPASAHPVASSSSTAQPPAIRSSSPDHVLREIEDVPPIPFDTQEELSFVLEKLKEQFMAKVVASVSEAGEGKEAEQRATRWAEKVSLPNLNSVVLGTRIKELVVFVSSKLMDGVCSGYDGRTFLTSRRILSGRTSPWAG